MIDGEWQIGDEDRRKQPYEYELQRVMRLEIAEANQQIIHRMDGLEKKIERWEDRAVFLNKVIIVSFTVTSALAVAYEWMKEHVK